MLFANDMAIQLLELDPDRLAKKSYWVLDLFTEEENPLFHRLFTSFVSGEMENLNILSVHTTLVSVRSRTPLSGVLSLRPFSTPDPSHSHRAVLLFLPCVHSSITSIAQEIASSSS